MDLNAGGEISDKKIGTIPNTLWEKQAVKKPGHLPERIRMNLPLNTELDPKSASGELAECVWDNPERNKQSNKTDEDSREQDLLRRKHVEIEGYSHDREATANVLT